MLVRAFQLQSGFQLQKLFTQTALSENGGSKSEYPPPHNSKK